MADWRARLTRWFTPLAVACPISPNAISLAAFAITAAGAVLLWLAAARPLLFLVAIIPITIGGLADALDGIVARAQGKESRFGDFLDHVLDRIGDGLLAGAWLLATHVRKELALAAVALTMLNGYVGTQIEATWGTRNYDSLGRGEFVLALVVYPIIAYIVASNQWEAASFAGFTVAEWLAAVMIAFALLGIAQRFVLARKLDRAAG